MSCTVLIVVDVGMNASDSTRLVCESLGSARPVPREWTNYPVRTLWSGRDLLLEPMDLDERQSRCDQSLMQTSDLQPKALVTSTLNIQVYPTPTKRSARAIPLRSLRLFDAICRLPRPPRYTQPTTSRLLPSRTNPLP